MTTLSRIFLFLASTIGNFLAALLILRFLMQALRVSFSGPFGEFVLALTNWLVRPLRRVIPGVFGLDWASLLPAWLIQSAIVALTFLVGVTPLEFPWTATLALGFVETLRIVIWVMIIALFLLAILSWFNPHSPISHTINQLCRPLLKPIQRFVPPVSGIDLSPMVALLVLYVVLIVLDTVPPTIVGALM